MGNTPQALPNPLTQSLSLESSFQKDWLDDQEAERNELIMRLRRIERNLVKYGRLQPQEARQKRIR